MLSRLTSSPVRNFIFRERDFDIREDEDVILRGAANFETKLDSERGLLLLTSKRLAYRGLEGFRPRWLGGKRTATDVALIDIESISSGQERTSPLNPLPQPVLKVVLKNNQSFRFTTELPEHWKERIERLMQTVRGSADSFLVA